jgi:hypothetical protein
MTGLLHERNQSVAQSREEVGRLLKEFYFKILGRLEILCEQTRGAGGTTLPVSNHFSTAEWPPPVQPSSSSKTSTVVVAPNWQTASPVPTPVTSRPPVSAAPSVPAGRADLQSHHTIRPASSGPSFTSSRSLPVPALLHPGLIQPTPVYPASNEVPSRLSLQAEQRSVPTWSSSSGSQMLVSPHSASARQVIPRTASADGDVPLVPTFEDLAASNVLPLPPAPPGITLHTTGSIAHQYAMRCHNLRTAVRKMAAGEGGRALSREEMVFWNTLCLSSSQSVRVKLNDQ